ncbi:SGNH/GDSL hydrolase family protein [Candidatus Saccharibacteria bacterium]|nr:SGNH/GDSL hydrolase family protein [Candidatus Saccharibacteria bacterium]
MSVKAILSLVGALVLAIIIVASIRLIILRRSIAEYRKYWEQQAGESIAENAFIYIALGDSAAQGIGASSPERGYVGLVAKNIEEKIKRPVHVINLSVSGAKVADVLSGQLPKLSKYPPPEIVTIEIGANDVGSFNADKFRLEFSQLLNELPANTLVSNVPSFRGSIKNNLKGHSRDASEIATELIKQKPELFFADIHAATDALGLGDYAADYFHPNDRAYKKWAEAFISAIEQNNLLL